MNENTAFYDCPACGGYGDLATGHFWDGDYHTEYCERCGGTGSLRVFAVVARSNPNLISLCADDPDYEYVTPALEKLFAAAGLPVYTDRYPGRMTDYGLFVDLLRLPPTIDTRRGVVEVDRAMLLELDAARYDQVTGWQQ